MSEAGDESLLAGSLRCPSCGGTLRPWGFARSRLVRNGGATKWVRPRRARCRTCSRTQVLLPRQLLQRRRDAVSDIGTVLEAYAKGTGYRRAARRLAIPLPTARNWIRGLRGRWWRLQAQFVSDHPLSVPIPDDPRATLEVMRQAAQLEGWPAGFWEFVAQRTNGSFLTHNTS